HCPGATHRDGVRAPEKRLRGEGYVVDADGAQLLRRALSSDSGAVSSAAAISDLVLRDRREGRRSRTVGSGNHVAVEGGGQRPDVAAVHRGSVPGQLLPAVLSLGGVRQQGRTRQGEALLRRPRISAGKRVQALHADRSGDPEVGAELARRVAAAPPVSFYLTDTKATMEMVAFVSVATPHRQAHIQRLRYRRAPR